jgi:hypothetical protein
MRVAVDWWSGDGQIRMWSERCSAVKRVYKAAFVLFECAGGSLA